MINYNNYKYPSQLLDELSKIEDAETFNEIIKHQKILSHHSIRKICVNLQNNKNIKNFFDDIYTDNVFKIIEISNFNNTTTNKNNIRIYLNIINLFVYHNKHEYLSEFLINNNYILFVYKLLNDDFNLIEKYIDKYENKYELFHNLISINHLFVYGDYKFEKKYLKVLIKYISYLKKTEIKKLLLRINSYKDENYDKIVDYVKSSFTPLQFIKICRYLKNDDDIKCYINKLDYNKEQILLGLYNNKNYNLYFNLLFEKNILNSSNINEFYLYLIHDARFVYQSNKPCNIDQINIVFIKKSLNIKYIEKNIESINFYNSKQRLKIHFERLKYLNRYIHLNYLCDNL